MKKIAVLLALSLCFFPFKTLAEPQESVISVDATVNSEIAPDTATIKFFLENSGLNLAELKSKNDKTVNAAIGEIKKKLKGDESVKTIAFSVSNIYSYKDKVRVFQKYQVRNGFQVKLKDLSKISEIIQIAMDNGIKNVEGLNFSVENGENECNALMANAIKVAKNRASYLASASGSEISKIKSMNPYCSLNSNFIQPRYLTNTVAKFSAGAAEDSVVESIEPGTINFRAGVNMTYYLK